MNGKKKAKRKRKMRNEVGKEGKKSEEKEEGEIKVNDESKSKRRKITKTRDSMKIVVGEGKTVETRVGEKIHVGNSRTITESALAKVGSQL